MFSNKYIMVEEVDDKNICGKINKILFSKRTWNKLAKFEKRSQFKKKSKFLKKKIDKIIALDKE